MAFEKRKLKPWVPKTPAAHHPRYAASRPVNATLPSAVDLRPLCPPVYDQLQTSSCEGNALADSFDFLQLQELRAKLPAAQSPEEYSAAGYEPCSRRMIYYDTCLAEGTAGQDGGVSSAADGCAQMMKLGVAPESLCPFSEELITVAPSPEAYAAGLQHKIGSYSVLETIDDMKHCLSQGFPFVCGIAIYDSFQSEQVADTGIVPMPTANDAIDGGHEVSIVGYNDATQMFILRNSWGADWGLAGYCMIPYAYITNGSLASEFLTVRK